MAGEISSKTNEGFINKAIDFLFSSDKRKWVILILILGILLRFLVASHVPPVPDEVVHGSHALGISELKPLSVMTQGPVWFYLTDISYKIFGVHLFSARFLSIIFGSLSIILVYLLGSELFNRKVGLFASFLMAISPFHIHWTAVYMDQTMMFFILIGTYLFLKEYKSSGKISLLAALFLGIASLAKIITPLFDLVFAFFMLIILYKNYKLDKNLFKENLKRFFIFGLILLVCFMPVLAHNYFLFKEKQLVDLPFSMYLDINKEFYQGPGLAHEKGFQLPLIFSGVKTVFGHYFFEEDPFNLILGIFGIGLVYFSKINRKDLRKLFILGLILFPLPIIILSVLLQTHYTSFIPLFAIFGGISLFNLNKFLRKFSKGKYVLIILLLLMMIFSINQLGESLSSKSAVEKITSFSEKIGDNNLVIVDSRIYTGYTSWMLSGKKYINANTFSQVMNSDQSSDSQKVNVHTFFIECVPDDCGWGTIKNQPELNESAENFVNLFSDVNQRTDIFGGGSPKNRRYESKSTPYFRIYETQILMNPEILAQVENTHSFFFYDLPRDRNPTQAYDYYEVKGILDKTLNFFAYVVLFSMIFLAIISTIFPFYLIYKQEE
ncbi:ArnT family glycosyltransferase [Nanoarchaeota archaeon]